jgi:hypothetical protein
MALRPCIAIQACKQWHSATPAAWLHVAQWTTTDFILNVGRGVRGPKM